MNEPHRGYVDLQSLHGFDYNTDLHLGAVPTAFESFQLAAGHPTQVTNWARSFPMPTTKKGSVLLNPKGESVWRLEGPTQGKCIWEMHGVWGWDTSKKEGVVLRENYFVKHPLGGRQVFHAFYHRPKPKLIEVQQIEWYADCFYPFIKKWEQTVRSVIPPHKFLFIEVIPNEVRSSPS